MKSPFVLQNLGHWGCQRSLRFQWGSFYDVLWKENMTSRLSMQKHFSFQKHLSFQNAAVNFYTSIVAMPAISRDDECHAHTYDFLDPHKGQSIRNVLRCVVERKHDIAIIDVKTLKFSKWIVFYAARQGLQESKRFVQLRRYNHGKASSVS